MEGREEVPPVRLQEEIVIIHDREPVPVVHSPDAVVEGHGLNVEGGKDGFLICHGGVIM